MVQGRLQIGLWEDIEAGGISNLTRHPLLEPVLAWARTEEAIRAVVITGSLARGDASTDQWSDLDAQIITCDIRRYSADDSWLDALGDVWIRFPLNEDVPYRLVWFAGGIKVDFQFSTVESIQDMRECGSLSDEYKRGYLVALDKDDLYRDLPPSPHLFPQPAAPSAEQVHSIINEFWFEAIHVAQFIRRREFWVVKFRDWTMKSDLLQTTRVACPCQRESRDQYLAAGQANSRVDGRCNLQIHNTDLVRLGCGGALARPSKANFPVSAPFHRTKRSARLYLPRRNLSS